VGERRRGRLRAQEINPNKGNMAGSLRVSYRKREKGKDLRIKSGT